MEGRVVKTECCIFINKITNCLKLQKIERMMAFITKRNSEDHRASHCIQSRDRLRLNNLDLHKAVLVVAFRYLSDSSHFTSCLYLAIHCNHIFISVQ